ncbi:MAG: diadenylate cyclase [Candidatus Paceibacterota bacterium]
MNLNLFLNIFNNISFGAKDALDIIIVSALVYLTVIVLQKTKSAPIIAGIIVLFIIYSLSVFFDLKLTEKIFHSIFGFLLVITAIIFQKELRRFFEIVGIVGLRRKQIPLYEDIEKTIINTVEIFIRKKIGALIVFPGLESIDRHLEGGYYLGGRISEPLLLSIFDPSSPGHDGAVIIEEDKIKKFAAHLPLAENVRAVRNFGTRHRAALGLSEVSDALIIVVSEEKGIVSFCRDKSFKTLENAQELRSIINDFFEEKFPKNKLATSKKWLKKNTPPIILSIASALTIWLISK